MTTTATTKKHQQPLMGKVISNKMEKTIVVRIDDIMKDPTYKKYVKRYRHVMAHDNENQCNIGDTVMISQAKPYSRKKAWTLVKIIENAKV